MNSLVYPVEGGMEDWLYAAGWDPENVKQCAPSAPSPQVAPAAASSNGRAISVVKGKLLAKARSAHNNARLRSGSTATGRKGSRTSSGGGNAAEDVDTFTRVARNLHGEALGSGFNAIAEDRRISSSESSKRPGDVSTATPATAPAQQRRLSTMHIGEHTASATASIVIGGMDGVRDADAAALFKRKEKQPHAHLRSSGALSDRASKARTGGKSGHGNGDANAAAAAPAGQGGKAENRAVVVLVETADRKGPLPATLGGTENVSLWVTCLRVCAHCCCC